MDINMEDYEEIPDLSFFFVDCKRYRHKVTGCELSISSGSNGNAPLIRMKQEDYNNGRT